LEPLSGTPDPHTHYVRPEASNTGAAPARTLTALAGPITTTTNGQVIENRDITGGRINVANDDVTIRNVRLTTSDYWGIYQTPGTRNLRIEHVTLIGKTTCAGSAMNAGAQVDDGYIAYSDISGWPDGLRMGSHDTLAYQNWIHGLATCLTGDPATETHNDGIQLSANATGTHATVVGNAVDPHRPNNSGLNSSLYEDGTWGAVDNNVIIGNWFGTGDYRLRLDGSHTVVADNEFEAGASFGDVAASPTATLERWVGNVRNTGAPVTSPR
jgi:hypothetical protein